MKEEIRFIEQMNQIAAMGKEHGGHITKEEVMKGLNGAVLNDSQWEVMGEFLYSRQVLLEGYQPSEEEIAKAKPYEFTTEEKTFMDYYQEELNYLPKKTDAQLEGMLKELKQSGKQPDGLYKALLRKLYETALRFADGREQLGDLVQEANLKCFEYLERPELMKKEPYLVGLIKEIELGLRALIAEGEDENLENHKITDKLNQLVETVEVLKEQNTICSMDDLSEFLDIPVEEIKNLLRLAGEDTEDDADKNQ